jgi:hypothetical protein
VPFEPDTPVFSADEDLIRKTIGLKDKGLYIGILDDYKIQVNIPEKHLFKHIAILSKTGGGKSYTAGVLLEELAENNFPAVVIDPHGEYPTIIRKNTRRDDVRIMESFGIEPKSYADSVTIFNRDRLIKLDSRLSADEISEMLQNLSVNQRGLLYSCIKKLQGKNYSIKDIVDSLLSADSQNKWELVSVLESLDKTKIFSTNPTKTEDIVKPGKISIIDLKEVPQDIQQMVVMKLAKELFEARKHGVVPEFVFVLEEAHNFCPERSFGETPSSKIIRTIAAEGRKFGLSLCVISQRPAKIDKNVLSQCGTQIILKVTNPNDLRAILDSLEGVTDSTKEEIVNLPIGVGLIVGITEQPLIVDIRVRRSEHGGEAIKTDRIDLNKKIPMFAPKYFESDVKKGYIGIENIELIKYPLWRVKGLHEGSEISIFVDGLTGEIVFQDGKNIEHTRGVRDLVNLPTHHKKILTYLLTENGADIEKISNDLNIKHADLQELLRELISKNYVAAYGDIFKNKVMQLDARKLSIKSDIISKEEGIKIDAKVSSETAKAIAEMFGMKMVEAEAVYCPYWSIITHKNRRFLINALDKKLDLRKSKIVADLL